MKVGRNPSVVCLFRIYNADLDRHTTSIRLIERVKQLEHFNYLD